MMQNGMITEWCPCAGSGEGQKGDGEGSGLVLLVLYMYLLAGQQSSKYTSARLSITSIRCHNVMVTSDVH